VVTVVTVAEILVQSKLNAVTTLRHHPCHHQKLISWLIINIHNHYDFDLNLFDEPNNYFKKYDEYLLSIENTKTFLRIICFIPQQQ
jgi:hypothetical protein